MHTCALTSIPARSSLMMVDIAMPASVLLLPCWLADGCESPVSKAGARCSCQPSAVPARFATLKPVPTYKNDMANTLGIC